MKHVFTNTDGELIAADSAEQASQYHDVELGGNELNPSDWVRLYDDLLIPVGDPDGGPVETKTAAEWAAEHDTPEYVATTYM